MNKLYDKVCRMIDDLSEQELRGSNLEMLNMLVDIKKDLLKIEKYEDEMGYSERGGYSRTGTRYGGDNMGGMTSYARNRRRDSMGRYSRAGAKDEMMSMLGEMMSEANGREREILEDAMRKLDMA